MDSDFDTANGAVTCSTTYNGVQYTQKLTITFNSQTGNYDIVEIRYTVKNVSDSTHKAGLRIMLDTMLGDNDKAPFNVDGIGDVTTQKEFSGSAIPDSWRAFDSLSEPSVIGYGFFKKNTSNLPDTVQFTSWQDVKDSNELWDAPVTESSANGDSAVTIKWLPRTLAPGKSMVCTTHYGLSKFIPNKDDIAFTASGDTALAVVDNTYSPSQVKVTVMAENRGTVNYSSLKVAAVPQGDHLRIASGNSDVRSISSFNAGEKFTQTFTFDVTPSAKAITEKILFKLLDSSGNPVKTTTSEGTSKNVTTTFSVSIPALTLTTEKLDLAFVIDTTGSMENDIAQVRQNIKDYINALNSNGIDYRIALVDYRDFSDRTSDSRDYAYSVKLNFTNNADSIQNALDNLTLGYGGDTPETVYSALIDGLRALKWRSTASVLKAGIVLGDAPPHDPEPKTGYTLSTVVDAMNGTQAADSSVSPILPGQSITLFTIYTGSSSSTDLFEKLAEGTSGTAYGGTNVDRAIEDFISWILFDIVISKQPITNVVETGGRVTFSVEAKGYRLTYQWQVSSDGSSWSNISGATSASYSFTQASSNLNKTYRCVIKNASGKQAITRVVGYSIASELKITQHPANVTVHSGDNATFKVTATGTGLKYQWQYKKSGETAWSNWGTRTTASTTAASNDTWNKMQVRCKVTDATGKYLYSNAATITIAAELKITSHPSNVTVASGSNATFKVVATGTGLKYQWQYKKSDATSWSAWSDRTTASTTATANDSWNKMQVRCKVTDAAGKYVYSNAATVTIGSSALSITKHPANVTVHAGDNATFKVTATGTGLKYQWQYKKSDATSWSAWSDRTTASTTATANNTWNKMQVRCKVTDSSGKSVYSNAATITIAADLKITSHPSNVTVASGSNATFKVAATGTGLKYQWQYKKSGDTSWSNWGSRTTASTSATANDSWNKMQVRCKVTDAAGKYVYSNAATITIGSVALSITKHPANLTVHAGDNATFKVTATGTGLKYQWYYKKSGATSWSAWSDRTTASTTATANDTWNKMQVRCKVTDSSGNSVYSNAATITIAAPLKITQQPSNLTTKAGNDVAFIIKASGTGLKYQWYYKKSGATSWTAWNGRTASSFFSTANSTWNGMQVRCIVTDAVGTKVTSNTIKITLQ